MNKGVLYCFCLFLRLSPLCAQLEEQPVPGQNLYVNQFYKAATQYPYLDGRDIRVSIKEFPFDSNDIDLKSRYFNTKSEVGNITTHATLMATLVGGAGIAEEQGLGAAPRCFVSSTGYNNLEAESVFWYKNQDIQIQNHSYGLYIDNRYSGAARDYDQTTQAIGSLLHVFSAGNKGDSSATKGKYANLKGYANLSGAFKMAKNALIVGAVDSFGQVPIFSSKGPAYDGRTKPDLVAFGHDGSSGAAALVSGAAALLQQVYREQWDSLPSSDWVRAILVNSAVDIGPPGPDFGSGFGNLNAQKSIDNAVHQRYITSEVSNGGTQFFPLSVPPMMRILRIALAWNDPSALEDEASSALVHDLDLILTSPSGQVYYPWVLSTVAQTDSLASPARHGRDTLNNIEQITIELPEEGMYQISVHGSRVGGTSQAFALAFDGDTLGHFDWIYPIKNSAAPAGKEVILRWEQGLEDSLVAVSWKPVNDLEWKPLLSAVPLQKGWNRCILPDFFGASQIRMEASNRSFISDTFLISKALQIKIGYNCSDSLYFYWNAAAPNAQYQIYGLGNENMSPVLVTQDTFLSVSKTEFPQQRFAVAAMDGLRAIGARSAAPDINTQGVGCYIATFNALQNMDGSISLDLDLGTSYGLEKVRIEKERNGVFVPLAEWESPQQMNFETRDVEVDQGANVYRAKLIRQNQALILSDTLNLWSTGGEPMLLYPNPVKRDAGLSILVQESEEFSLLLFNVAGDLIEKYPLTGTLTKLDLRTFSPGVYLFQLNRGGSVVESGKLVIME